MEENIAATAGVSETVTAEQAAPQKKQRKPINQQKLQDNLWGWAFCIPLIIGTVWFVYIAFVMSVLLSFTNYKIGDATPLLGVIGKLGDYIIKDKGTTATTSGAWHWYAQVFTQTVKLDDPTRKFEINEAGAYFFNTVFYMIGIPIGMILAVFFAVCMSRDIKGGNFFRVVYYIPSVASSIAIIYTCCRPIGVRALLPSVSSLSCRYGRDSAVRSFCISQVSPA